MEFREAPRRAFTKSVSIVSISLKQGDFLFLDASACTKPKKRARTDYLRSNRSGLKNYALERRKGRRISSALAESVMSHLVNQRMGKRQRMRWSCEGAHLLLQVRCAVLDKQLDTLFREWHPNFRKQQAAPLAV